MPANSPDIRKLRDTMAIGQEMRAMLAAGDSARAAQYVADSFEGEAPLSEEASSVALEVIATLSKDADHRAGRLIARMTPRAAVFAVDRVEAGVASFAAALAESEGRFDVAIRMRSKLGHYADIARLARSVGRLEEAADLLLRAGKIADAAELFAEAQLYEKALHSWLMTPRGSDQYRHACARALLVAEELGEMSYALADFASAFLATDPNGPEELQAFLSAARLKLRSGDVEASRDILDRLESRAPNDPDVQHAARSLRTAEMSPEALKALTQTRRTPGSSLTALPDLPALPGLPAPEELSTPYLDIRRAGGGIFGPDSVVDNRYRLQRQIGRGGSSIVFAAKDEILGEQVALKAFTQAVPDEAADRRFRRELRISRDLTHRNLVRIRGVGAHMGFRYITMELLDGQDLRRRLAAPIPMKDALEWAAQVCDGLDLAHQHGVIHRDVKPENCFLTIDGVVKLMDFGIARVQAAPGVTVTSTIFGTPAYISPEQVSDYRGVTAQSDLYSLGVMLYEFLARRLPFVSPDLFTLLKMHSEAAPPPLRSVDPRIPAEIEAVVMRLLSKKAADRPASAHETRRLLIELRDAAR